MGTTKITKKASSSSSSPSDFIFSVFWWGASFYIIYRVIFWAYQIRLHAIKEYGAVIHEFDPYFNYRATEYLFYNGAKKFFTWFDHMVWYPLGRPVGTTIYPGMQFTAVWIKRYLLDDWSLNDVCCYIPAWFGAIASCIVGLITYECSLPQNSSQNLVTWAVDIFKGKMTPTSLQPRKSWFQTQSPALECGICAMGMMAIVPAHIMRSVGGGYDNESVAVSAMNLTFYFWVRSLREGDNLSWIFGIFTGLAYFYMVASWGGYIFVLNMVGLHAALLVAMGRFSTKIYLSYSLFYVVGTALAIQVPVVGWTPLKSLEQLAPCAVFLGYQVMQFCEYVRKKNKLSRVDAWKLRLRVSLTIVGGLSLLCVFLAPSGYFGPLSSRVRGLFVQHTKTGNPLVDSVAEHQAASPKAYFQYLHNVCTFAPLGYLIVFCRLGNASSFLLAWGTAAYFFSHKMVRLILLTAPIGSALAGIATGRILAWSMGVLWDAMESSSNSPPSTVNTAADTNGHSSNGNKNSSAKPTKEKKTKKAKRVVNGSNGNSANNSSFEGLDTLQAGVKKALKSPEGILVQRTVAVLTLLLFGMIGNSFVDYCWKLASQLSHPSIILQARTRDGKIVKVDDYREAYWWLRDNTPKDSRIMAWWDYGYQITGIANRTTIADGNTWNHEHIALLGKALTTDLHEGYDIARHLADYVLIWGGGGGDDLAKSPHLARIANSVYRDHCPKDPTCRAFGFVDRQGTPSPMMERSFLYQLHSHKIRPGVEVPAKMFQEVFRSTYGKVRVYKIMNVSIESKNWVADPKNRKCDAGGSWFCPGQYPPGLDKILARGKNFAQLEDFNRGDSDEEYQKEYFEALKNPDAAKARALQEEAYRNQKSKHEKTTKEKSYRVNPDGSTEQVEADPVEKEKISFQKRKDNMYKTFVDSEDTTRMWKLITEGNTDELKQWLRIKPEMAFLRSQDGRGPMWWAYESRKQDIVKLLMKAGVPHTDKDLEGMTPADLLES